MTVHKNEIYPYPPVEVVAFELRIPYSLALADRAVQAQVWQRLRKRLPITQPQAGLQVAISAPMMGAQQPLRILDRARTESVVIGAETIVVENTSYRCYEDFCELLLEVLSAASTQEIAGFTRIGLRYINEIRIPGIVAPGDWEDLVHPALLAGGGALPPGYECAASERRDGVCNEHPAQRGDALRVLSRARREP